MFAENIQAITATAGNFQRGMMIERSARMGRAMCGFGFHPLLAFFGFLLFVLFIVFVIRAIKFAHYNHGNYGFGYRHQLHERYSNEKCACENRPNQNHEAQNPWMHKKADEALEILRKRYAAGEINKEEYLIVLDFLNKGAII